VRPASTGRARRRVINIAESVLQTGGLGSISLASTTNNDRSSLTVYDCQSYIAPVYYAR
jgi:hypothetical protein